MDSDNKAEEVLLRSRSQPSMKSLARVGKLGRVWVEKREAEMPQRNKKGK